MIQKLKSWLLDDVVFYTVLLISVAVVAFLLGRQSIVPDTVSSVGVQVIQNQTAVGATQLAETTQEQTDVVVVASRSGAKYHLPSCSGAKQIKESNKITFSSIEKAKAAGYSAAANCKGL